MSGSSPLAYFADCAFPERRASEDSDIFPGSPKNVYDSDQDVESIGVGSCSKCGRHRQVAKLTSGDLVCSRCVDSVVACSVCANRIYEAAGFSKRTLEATKGPADPRRTK